MKCIPVQEAVGSILCHDITQILPGEFKGRRFKKGHIIQEEDIPVLLSLGSGISLLNSTVTQDLLS